MSTIVVDDDDLASEDGSEHENDDETGTDFDLSATIETVETDAQTQATGSRFKKDVVVGAVRKVCLSVFQHSVVVLCLILFPSHSSILLVVWSVGLRHVGTAGMLLQPSLATKVHAPLLLGHIDGTRPTRIANRCVKLQL